MDEEIDKNETSVDLLLKRFEENWSTALSPRAANSILVQRVSRLLQMNSAKCLERFELSLTEFEVLSALRSFPEPHMVTPTHLYEAVLISSGGLTKVLKALEARSLICRPVTKGDKRKRPLALTDKGRQLVEDAMGGVMELDVGCFEKMTVQNGDLSMLNKQLNEMLKIMEQSDGL